LVCLEWLVALPIRVFLAIGDACIHSQNIPNTTAVRKAKDMMAASTLSLVRSSINASFAGLFDRPWARVAPPQPAQSRWRRGGPPAKFDVAVQ
jgi:hypothetical protein